MLSVREKMSSSTFVLHFVLLCAPFHVTYANFYKTVSDFLMEWGLTGSVSLLGLLV